MSSWLILRILHGNPFKIEEAIGELGIATYLPRYSIKRRDPRDRRRILDVRKPLLPGWLFVSEVFELEAIPPAMLTRARQRAHDRWVDSHGRSKPATADCRVKWLGTAENPGRLTEAATERLYQAERHENGWRELIEGISHALDECAKGKAARSRYVRLSEFQGVAA